MNVLKSLSRRYTATARDSSAVAKTLLGASVIWWHLFATQMSAGTFGESLLQREIAALA